MYREHGGSTFRILLLVIVAGVALTPAPAAAQTAAFDNAWQVPDVRGVLPTATDAKGVSSTLQILVLMTVLTLAPSILILMTSFTRIIIVLALLRQAMATPPLPPGQVLLGLSLFVTLLVMAPTFDKINEQAVQPYSNNEITQREALTRAVGPLREFMFRQIEASDNFDDIYLFEEYRRGAPLPDGEELQFDDVRTTVLIPAFILGELKTAFVIGFRVYLPFLVIDMVIASILISMGMMMLPPVLISLPFKLLLFVLADGWHLVMQTLLYSFT